MAAAAAAVYARAMRLPHVVAFLLAAVSVACPGHPAPPIAPIRTALVTRAEPAPDGGPPPTTGGRSPAEKFAAGELVFGVYTIHDVAHCELASWDATAAALGLDGARVLDRELTIGDTGVAVGAMADGVVGDLTPIMTALRDAGGSDIDGHHVCVVPATGVGVALSTSNGFIAFEPAAIIQINELVPDAERSMYSVVVVFAHEFAHQLQYWYGNPFAGDKSMRRTELAADCMGSAFVAMTQPSGWIMEQVHKGVVGALQAYADLKFRSVMHHGTRVDRAQLAHAGVELVTSRRAQQQPLDLATIKRTCDAAVEAWDASLTLTPPDQLWGGTEP